MKTSCFTKTTPIPEAILMYATPMRIYVDNYDIVDSENEDGNDLGKGMVEL